MRGLTLIELIIVLVIFSIVISIGVYAYNSYSKKISIENDVYSIYTMLNKARTSAFTEKISLTVRLIGTDNRTFIIDNDTNSTNGYFDEVNLTNAFYSSTNGALDSFRFDRNGFADYQGHIRSIERTDNSIDCVVVSFGRIAIGKFDGNQCKAK